MRTFEQRWPQTERVWQQFTQMDLVMERLGVDCVAAVHKAQGAAMLNARNLCVGCSFQRRCRTWVKQDGDLRGLAEFCPNAGFFEECRRGH